MQKGDPLPSRTILGGFVDESAAGCAGLGKVPFKVVASIGDVMDAASPVVEVFPHGAFRCRGFQQFDTNLADAEESDFDLLGGNLFDSLAFQTQRFLVEGDRLPQGFYGDADMVDLIYHGFRTVR